MHIIDVHVQKTGIKGLFDPKYVQRAALKYNREEYKRTFLPLDTIFPLAYSFFLISIGYKFRRRVWFRFVAGLVVLGALFDYGENLSFLAYLYNPSYTRARTVAFCTSLKSVLLLLNIVTALILLIKTLFFNDSSLGHTERK